MHGKSLLKPLSFVALLLGTPGTVPADGIEVRVEEPAEALEESTQSSNKTGQFLPGEKVRTESGQVLKVWSTAGPVPVSPPPEPFQHPSQQLSDVIDDVHIVIDKDGIRQPKKHPRKRHDSFDVRSSPKHPR